MDYGIYYQLQAHNTYSVREYYTKDLTAYIYGYYIKDTRRDYIKEAFKVLVQSEHFKSFIDTIFKQKRGDWWRFYHYRQITKRAFLKRSNALEELIINFILHSYNKYREPIKVTRLYTSKDLVDILSTCVVYYRTHGSTS